MLALSPYRILDLTNERADLAGLLLAGLGADVIAVEPPSGSSARRLSPFYADREDLECSLVHWAHNRGKRSVVVDLESPTDAQLLSRLARGADVLIEDRAPGEMADFGFGYEQLAKDNPCLVYVSVSPFGQDGPKANWAASDLTIYAACGGMALNGDPDRAPLRVGVPQVWVHAGAAAAGAALLGLYERNRSGRGQHIDVSAQQAAAITACTHHLTTAARATLTRRAGGGMNMGGLKMRYVYPAKDGFVTITNAFGPLIGPFTARLMAWLHEEGFCDRALRDKDWVKFGTFLSDGTEPLEELERMERCIADFVASKTKAELFAGAVERRALIVPVATAADVCEFGQFKQRDHWEDVFHSELRRSLAYTGTWARFSRTPISSLPRAPKLGQHTQEVVDEPDRVPAVERPDAALPELPLSGVKILDFTWVAAGPFVTRVMADYGATVLRIESSIHPDGARSLGPFLDDQVTVESSVLFSNLNAGKLGITLDVRRPESREVVEDLVRWADIVIDSFSPRAMRSWGLDYESLRRLNPAIIMFSGSLLGASGPYATFAGFGNLAASLCGFYDVTGWPDRPPAGPFGAYTDMLSPHFGLVALLAALEYRRRTGEGQFIDFSQAEASLLGMQPALLDVAANGRVTGRIGNDDPNYWPHGAYPSAEPDGWVAIACTTDDMWLDLCTAIGNDQLREDPVLRDARGRQAQRDAIDSALAAWTAVRPAEEAVARLQQVGVAAHTVQSSPECVTDPQFLARRHFVDVVHPVLGSHTIEGSRYRFSRTPGGPRHAAPTLNGDLETVLTDILAYDQEKIADLVSLQIFE